MVATVPKPPKAAGVLVLWVVAAVCPNAMAVEPEENCSVLPEVVVAEDAELSLLDTGAGAEEEGKSEEAVEPNTEAEETVEAVEEAAWNKGLKVGVACVSAAVVVVEDMLKMGLNPEGREELLVLGGRLKRLGAGVEVVLGGGAGAEVEAGGAEVAAVRLGWAGAEEAGAVVGAGAGEGLFLFRTSSSRELCGAVLRL